MVAALRKVQVAWTDSIERKAEAASRPVGLLRLSRESRG